MRKEGKRGSSIEKEKEENGRMGFYEVEGTEREIPCELALIAIGFVHTQPKGLLESLGVSLDARGNVQARNHQTNLPTFLRRAMCAAGSRWWCGPFPKAAKLPVQ